MTRAIDRAVGAALRLADRHRRLEGARFDPATSIRPPSGGRWSWVHYGVMVPGLPEPHRTFGVMAILGSPGVAIFANDQVVTTTRRDTATVVSATAAMRDGSAFHAYSMARDCELAPDGSVVRLGEDVAIEGALPTLRVRRHHPDVEVDLTLHATDVVTHFVDVIGGAYQHWSVLCEYTGNVGATTVGGLCTFEDAHGIAVRTPGALGNLAPPTRFFAYHVLNVDDRTQLLLSDVRSVAGVPVIRSAFLRGPGRPSEEYGDVTLTVTEHEPLPRPTPDGRTMSLPARLEWLVRDDAGREVVRLAGRCHGDWQYGLGAGFVGSYDFEGTVEARPVRGTAYAEHVDLRVT